MNKKLIKAISFILAINIFFCSFSVSAFATEGNTEISAEENKSFSLGEAGGYLSGNLKIAKNLYEERKFSSPNGGHGFAAERANSFYERLEGIKNKVVGDNNVKDGPDRIVFNRNGKNTLVQDKYYQTAAESVNSAFGKDGMYRYFDGDGAPMQLEVPSDQYDDAVIKMKEKIKAGKVKNITDPNEAGNIIRKGKLSYKQAVNLTKAGNIDSLKYDAATGIISSAYVTGISFAINFAIASINGEDLSNAFLNSLKDSLKTGGVVFLTNILVKQLTKTKLNNLYAPAGKALTNVLGENLSRSILEIQKIPYTGKNIINVTSKFLSKAIHSQVIMLIVLTMPDIIDLFRGRISPEQLIINLTVGASGMAGGAAGAAGGAAIGSAIAPGAGSVVGGIVGGLLGFTGASIGAELLIDNFTESDAEKMYSIIQDEFKKLSEEYIISKDEGDKITDKLHAMLDGETIKDMYESKDRNAFANKMIRKLFEEEIAQRNITIPSDEESRAQLKETLSDVVYIH